MATLIIKIKGIALVTMEDKWKVYLPFEDCHRVTITSLKHKLKKNLNSPKATVEISVKNSAASPFPEPIPMPDPNSFSSIFDVTGSGAHENGVCLIADYDKNTTVLTVDGGVYSTATSNVTYSLFDAGGSIAKKQLGPIAADGEIKIEGEKILLKISTNKVETYEFDKADVIIIDNDCKANRNNDFPMLYKYVIKDSVTAKKQFLVKPDSATGDLPCNNFRVSKPLKSCR